MRIILGRRRRRAAAAGLLALLSLVTAAFFPGCQANYLRRQALGALRVITGRVPIDAALLERVSESEREKLAWVARVREFAKEELGLEPGDSYTTYYDTHGAPISYIVAAAHPLALKAYRWTFPIVGRVPYKGHFDPREATAERDRLAREGWDTVRLPVRAFSSLGWFSDPVLSTMLSLGKGDLADLLIHEITHRTLYFEDHTELNESLATVVAREGTQLLLMREFGADCPELREYREGVAQDDLRDGILDRLWRDLDALYRSSLFHEAKLLRKAELFSTASRALRLAGLAHNRLEASNASLVLGRQYSGLVPVLQAIQSALGGHPRNLVESLVRLRGSDDPLEDLRAQLSLTAFAVRPPPEK